MPTRKQSRERPADRQSGSKSPMPRSTSGSQRSNRSHTPPRSASPAGRRRIVKGASIRGPERASSVRQPRRKISSTEYSTRSSSNRSMSPISATSKRVASEPATKSKAPFKRMNSLGNPRGPSRINSLQPPASSTQPRPPTRINSLGNPGGSQRIRGNPPKSMDSLGNPGGQTRTSAPRRTHSLDPEARARTSEPKRTNSVGPGARIRSGAPRRTNSVGPATSPRKSPKLSPKQSSRSVKMDPESIKPPSLGRISKDDAPTKSKEPASAEMVKENMSTHRRPNRFKRWGFGGGVSDFDDEYGDSFRIDLSSLAKSSKPGEPISPDNQDYYDSDNSSDLDSINMRDPESLPSPHSKRKEGRVRSMAMFPDDKWWQKCLRYYRILPPTPNEGRTRRNVRRLIWATLIFDVLVAIVTVTTFSGTVTMCCNQATMAPIPTIDWNLFMKVVSYIYLVGIFLEVHPVVREGPVPWNLLNPMFGSLLSFAAFVDDSKAEAIGIWILELGSVILEMVTYRNLRKLYQREERRLEKLDTALNGDQDALYRKGGQYKQNAYLRERRLLRIEHAENKSKLRYHFVGVSVNFVLVGFTLLLMIVVARGQGMCMVGGEGLDLFHPDQPSRCNQCKDLSNGWKERCQICKDGPNTDDTTLNDPVQCFYPYF